MKITIKEISLFLFIFSFILTLRILNKRILIVRTDRVGDVVMITPMITGDKKEIPGFISGNINKPNTANILTK